MSTKKESKVVEMKTEQPNKSFNVPKFPFLKPDARVELTHAEIMTLDKIATNLMPLGMNIMKLTELVSNLFDSLQQAGMVGFKTLEETQSKPDLLVPDHQIVDPSGNPITTESKLPDTHKEAQEVLIEESNSNTSNTPSTS